MTYFNYDFLNSNINYSLMKLIYFLNNNFSLILGSLLVLGLFIYFSDKSNKFNANPESKNIFNVNFGNGGAGSFPNAPSNSSSNNNSSLGPGAAAIGISGTFAGAAATMAKNNPRVAVITAGLGATASVTVYVAGEILQALKEERKHIREINERSSSPPPDGNFKINSPNENGNNFVEFISKLFENPQDFFNLANEYLTGSDGNPTPMLILLICSFAFWGIIGCLFLIMSMLSKQLKIEEREFIKNRPLLHKLVCFMISLRDWNNFVLLILTLLCFIGILVNCYVLNELFWFTDSYK